MLASMRLVSTYIHHQIAVIVTTSGDVNRHSSSFKMATVLKDWTKEVCHSFFMGKNIPPVEIHRELVTLYNANVMTVHVRKWCREFESGLVNVMDEQRSGCLPRLLILFRILM
jgi:hypothetical protein